MSKRAVPKLNDKVEVEWWDATGDSGPPCRQLYLRTTIGWLLFVGKCEKSGFDIITIGATKDKDGDYDDQSVIPRGWVKRWHKL